MGRCITRIVMMGKVIHIGRGNYKQGVRRLGSMTIFFASKESVYIGLDSGTVVIVHRWGDMAKGRYGKAWRPFTSKLKLSKNIETIYDIIKLANEYELGFICSTRAMPEIPDGVRVY